MLRDLARRLPEWDASAKVSLALAVALLIFLVALGFAGPQETRFPARIGAFGMLVSLQLIFLWANRRHISPYHQAQTYFVAGDYQKARSLLEAIPESSRVSVDALVLLGNCYRHLGLFEQSAAALTRALEIKPEHHLALFSRGKLYLVLGEYSSAVDMIQRALAAGAPNIVRFELGQAYFHTGEFQKAKQQLNSMLADKLDDPPLALMSRYYLFRMGELESAGTASSRRALDHWREEARKYDSTAYGESIRLIVAELDESLDGKQAIALTSASVDN